LEKANPNKTMKTIFLIPAVLILTMNFAHADPGRKRQLIDLNWKFSQTDTTGAAKFEFSDNGWRILDLPHDWSIEGDFSEHSPTGGGGGYLPTGIGWYRKHLILSRADLKQNVWIEFDGVYQNSDVWINGHHLGHYPSGYMSFYYDLTPYLRAGENVVAVRVDNSRQPNSRWYTGSGIYRHVWLTLTDPLHVAPWGTYVFTSRADSIAATIVVRTKIVNTGTAVKKGTLRSVAINPDNRESGKAESAFSVEPGKIVEVEQQIQVSAPARWSVEHPSMYTCQSTVVENGKPTDAVTTPFGIRALAFDADSGFRLNGKRLKINGVCLHHEAGSVGAAVPEAVWERRLQVLKAMGCNAIRTSHNPAAPEFLDLCDRLGFLVMDEAFDEWTSPKVKFGYSNYFKEWSQHDVVNFIRRDRNHPSVILWSAGNEIGEQKMENGLEILRPLLDAFHREDPTRPVTTGNDNIAADNGSARLPFLAALDIVGYNYVDRWHERRELFYSIDRHDHPDWKMIGTESVSIQGARGNYFGGTFGSIDSTIIRPANMAGVVRAEQLWKYVSSHDYVMGDFMWTGIDYLGESRWPNKNSSSGVIDLCGFPKDAFYFYQSQWTTKPMIHLSPHWNWKGREGKVISVMAFTNCESVELFVNGKSFGVKALEFPRQGNSGAWNRYDRTPVNSTTGDLHLTWDVPYEPGTVKAIGRKGDKVECEETLQTTGAPAGVRLVADRGALLSGDRNVVQVRVEVVDAGGLIVPDAANRVEFSIDGPGRLIGLDNGNPRDHDAMKGKSRKTFNGLALAIVQADGATGTIRIKATSAGLSPASLDVSVRSPGGSKP
jgi:beta-galactosidase